MAYLQLDMTASSASVSTSTLCSVLSCGINEEGSRIVSSGEDCTVRVWSTEDGQQLMQLAAQVRCPGGHAEPQLALCSPPPDTCPGVAGEH